LDWRINDDFRLRATTSVDIRAPSLNDLYQPATSTSIGFNDILTQFGNGLESVAQGNPNLVPEVSRTYTAGVVYTPTYIPGLTFSVDYYNIKMKNAIGNISGNNVQIQNICNASGGTSPYCALFVRPFPYTNTTPANYPLYVLQENLNSAYQATEGEDYELDYAFDTADVASDLKGLVNLRTFVNVQPIINSVTFPGAQVSHTNSQKGHAAIFASYTLNNWSVNYQLTWFSDLHKNQFLTTPTYYAQERVPSFNTSDITVNKKLNFDDGSIASVYVSVQNVFNAQTPVVTGSAGNPGVGLASPAGEDTMGRYFTIGIRGSM
jgi:outer membrane receptor protein involved in Fe transport